jgi:tRNA(Ile2) C34 agmatinyltransferase TiaS
MTLAKCAKCGVTLIAPDDGYPYWCTKCSYEYDERVRQQAERERP